MARYVFECQECTLRFDRNLKMGDHPTHECPNCHYAAPQVIEGFAFGFKETVSAAPGNSGVHKDDYPTADQAVGKDADKRWAQYSERDQVKNQVRKMGDTHALVRRTAKDGSYVEYDAMTTTSRQNRRTVAKKAIEALRTQKPVAR